MADVTGFTGEPWQVTMSPTGDGHVVHLIIAGVMVILPPLAAHKLGSALHAASGIDTSDAGHGENQPVVLDRRDRTLTSWRAFASTFDLSGETMMGKPLIDVDAALGDEPVIGTASPRDLQRVLVGVFTAMFPPTRTDGSGAVDYTDLPRHVREVVRQRDQLQAAYQTLLRRFLPDEYDAWMERQLHGDESSAGGAGG